MLILRAYANFVPLPLGIKANVTPMCAEQYQNARPVLKTLKSGEQVIVDPELTV
jgi:POT family proton-dependent oligopeptide transporter